MITFEGCKWHDIELYYATNFNENVILPNGGNTKLQTA